MKKNYGSFDKIINNNLYFRQLQIRIFSKSDSFRNFPSEKYSEKNRTTLVARDLYYGKTNQKKTRHLPRKQDIF